MAEYVRRNPDSGFPPKRPEEIVDICIIHRFPCIHTAQLQKHMVGIYFTGMDFADIFCKEVHQFLCAVQFSGAVDGLDFRQIRQLLAVRHNNLKGIQIEVLQPKGERLANTHPRLKEQVKQEIVTHVCAFTQQGDCLIPADPADFPLLYRHL